MLETHVARSTLGKWLDWAALFVLLLGLAGALGIFVASERGGAAGNEEIVDGVVYPIKPDEDRHFRYEVERMGGTMGLMMVEFDDWFADLWHGRELAYTVAVLSLVGAGILHFVAGEIGLEADGAREDGRG